MVNGNYFYFLLFTCRPAGRLFTLRIAIVHDDFMQWGGAERLVLAMSEIWPNAPIYTAVCDNKVLPKDFPKDRLVTSFMQRLPEVKRLHRHFFWIYPLAFESFNFDQFDVVLSSTTRFAKSVITKPRTLHICYCNTPPRFLWAAKDYINHKKFNIMLRPIYKILLPFLISFLRLHDQVSSARVDYFIANSKNVAKRIKNFYNRDSVVIYPFVELERFSVRGLSRSKSEEAQAALAASSYSNSYFLIVSRLGGHKRVDLAIEAFNKLGLPLIIIGDGPEKNRYQKLARSNIKFLGELSDEKVVEYYRNCRAFIYPQVEDFGITALEAQAAGRPVIAFQEGGVLETVIDSKTGVFFSPQTAEGLIGVISKFDSMMYSAKECREQAERFSKQRFQTELKSFVEEKWKEQERISNY